MSADAIADLTGTRGRALGTALDLFARDGYDGVSMRQIAEELGVTKAALYHHFASKEEIARELVGSYFAAVDELVAWARATSPDLDEVLARWGELVRDQGLRIGKFLHANHRLIRELGLHGPDGPRRAIDLVSDAVVGPDAPVLRRVQVRMALLCVSTAAIAAEGLPMDADEVFRLGRDVAASIVHNAGA